MESHHYVFALTTEDEALASYAEIAARTYHPLEVERLNVEILRLAPPTKTELYRRGWHPPRLVPLFQSFPSCTTYLKLSIDQPCDFSVEYVRRLPLHGLELLGFNLNYDEWASFVATHPPLMDVAFHKCAGIVTPMVSVFTNPRLEFLALLRCDVTEEDAGRFESALQENTTKGTRLWKDRRVRCV